MSHLTIKEVCQRFQCSRATVYRWIKLDGYPRGLVIGGTVRWPIRSIEEYEAERLK